MGQCPGCGEWNTLTEETAAAPTARGGAPRGRAVRPVTLADALGMVAVAERARALVTGGEPVRTRA